MKTENEDPLFIFVTICYLHFMTKNIQVVNEIHSFIKVHCDMEVTVLSLLLMSLFKTCCNMTNSLESLPYFTMFLMQLLAESQYLPNIDFEL